MRIFLLFVFLFIYQAAFSQKESPKKKYRKLYFYTAGRQASPGKAAPCFKEQADRMGFGYKVKGGCVVGPMKKARIKAHNDRVEKKLSKRLGTDWRTKYEAAMNACDPR